MRIVFFGTPPYVVPVIDKLHKAFKSRSLTSPIQAVVTQKPKPEGRKKRLKYSAVDTWAHTRDIPILLDAGELLSNSIRADVGVLAAYGEIISKEIIDSFPQGILNIHPSLLPKYRGASPVRAALVTGEKQTGVTIIKMDEKLDHGKVVSQFSESISNEDTTQSLRSRLFERSAEVIETLLPAYLKGKVTLRSQNHNDATFTTQIRKSHAFIDPGGLKAALEGKTTKQNWQIDFIKDTTLKYSPKTVERFIRAMQPWPVAWTKVKLKKGQDHKRLIILKARLETSDGSREQKLVLDEVQLEGKNAVTWKQFQEGYPSARFESD
ncbi:MAG: methionyl-tRNA formyltransferase [Candidatus Woesebacteria bacterium]|jgi:methionyl-tRNA formyltransferase